jgi:AraC-like DNA-binding protein
MLHDTLERAGDPLKATELFYDTFGTLLNRQERQDSQFLPAPVDANALGEVIEFLRLHYVESISLDAIARRFRQTPFQLIRSFKKLTGLTPYAYLTQVRLKAACSLLIQGEAIASIAPAVGLYDQSALTRCFKRSLGITPLQFVEAAGTRHGGPREKGAIGVWRAGISAVPAVPPSARLLPGDSMLRPRNT